MSEYDVYTVHWVCLMITRLSLETRWLKLEKWISIPPIVLVDNLGADCQGKYYSPQYAEIELDGRMYPLDDGLIVYRMDGRDDYPSVLAHEIRHHWQQIRGYGYDGVDVDFSDPSQYEKNILKYFLSSKCEMDALLYADRKHKTDVHSEWIEWLIKHRKENRLLTPR